MSLDVYLEKMQLCDVFTSNITHNLGGMAREAGIYTVLWRPDELGYTQAHELIPKLEQGLALLAGDPARFRALNPANGWGNYDNLVTFVTQYLAACRDNPKAVVRVWR